MRLLASLLCLLFGLAAYAEDSLSERGGQFLTVRVEAASADIATTFLDLNSDLRGLRLRSEGGGVWTGSFVLLPDMISGTVRPEVHLYDEARRELPHRSGVSIELASSDLDRSGLATALASPNAEFVFGQSIGTASIHFGTTNGRISPEFSSNSFTLPGRISPASVSAIVAKTTEGVQLNFFPDWAASVIEAP